ncbi:MAG: hypothetical protein WCP80_02170 [Phycisphaerales bacterium]|jgi:hypothetical protein
MKAILKSIFLTTLALGSVAFAQSDAPPLPAEINPPGWPLAGYGLAFLLVGGAVYVSMYVSKRTNID